MESFGVVGLGKIGGGLAGQALRKKFTVVGYDRAGADEKLTQAGLVEAKSLDELVKRLETPRAIFLYLPAGEHIDATLDALARLLVPKDGVKDVVVDGGNSYWGDSLRRQQKYAGRFHLADVGTSGGVSGAENGACFMAGGVPEALDRIEPILKSLCVQGGYVRAGGPGSGHFVKLVHNGIEFGMLQAIGEGVALLEGFPGELPIRDVLACWENGSVIRSWLVTLMREQMEAKGGLDSIPSFVEDTGEVNWLVADALHMEVPVPVIAQSIWELFRSRGQRHPDYRAVAMMRHGFGGHPFGPHEGIAQGRRKSRRMDYLLPDEYPKKP
jgi:6-phosphogluconate dehydrogenase